MTQYIVFGHFLYFRVINPNLIYFGSVFRALAVVKMANTIKISH